MSYCRWSSNDFRCDVYVFESSEGWETMVACRRHLVPDADIPPPINFLEDTSGYMSRERRVREMIETAGYAAIGLPHDGECFLDCSPGECADRLEGLQALGYRVPGYAIDALREEQAERDAA